METVETVEAKVAYECLKAINTYLQMSEGEQTYRKELNELYNTLHLINNPLFAPTKTDKHD